MSRSCAARPPAAATWVRIAPKPSAWISKARTTLTSASPCRPASRSIGYPVSSTSSPSPCTDAPAAPPATVRSAWCAISAAA